MYLYDVNASYPPRMNGEELISGHPRRKTRGTPSRQIAIQNMARGKAFGHLIM